MKNDGGSAFPGLVLENRESGLQAGHTVQRQSTVLGMSLRDYFAAKALNGVIAYGAHTTSLSNEEIVATCYEFADAMLAYKQEGKS